jgi:hypothetical protein
MKILLVTMTTLRLMTVVPGAVYAQKEKTVPACTERAFAALRAMPKLKYECPEEGQEWDEKILKMPARLTAIRRVMKALESFTNPAWWQAEAEELNACSVHHKVGALTDEEKHLWRQGGYSYDVLGNHEMRIAQISDPCYQVGYSGSNVYLLYRKDGKVFVSQLINGYYSRVDNSVGVEFAKLNGQQIIEIATANSMPPTYVSYYYAIDAATRRALPKKIFRVDGKLTNEIYSEMLMASPEDVGLPKTASELNIIRNGHMAPSFSAYEQDDKGKIEANDQKFRRIVYRWNGRFYSPR